MEEKQKYIVSTYVISLSNPIDLIEDLKNNFHLSAKWIPGINGKLLTSDEIKEVTNSYIYQNFGPKSVLGCALAHIKTWKTFLNSSSSDYALIFEEDVILDKKLFDLSKIKKCIHLNPYFDIFYLGCIGCADDFNLITTVYKYLLPNLPKSSSNINKTYVSNIPISKAD